MIAMLFPGQGSQSLGMLNHIANEFGVIKQTFSLASEVLGYDLWALVQQDEARLNQTEYTQPALLTASVALWRLWTTEGKEMPVYMAGHSLGEYSALVCAGSLTFEAGVELVAERGRLMQNAQPEGKGAMAAIIGLEDDVVVNLCSDAAKDQILSAANFNAIGQVVVSGEVEAVERLIALAEKAGARMAKKIPVSVPSHCYLMKPAAEHLADYLEKVEIATPKIPVIANVDVKIHNDPQDIREALVKQLFSSVRWVETIRYLIAHEVGVTVECGPGKVLAGLNKRIDRKLSTLSIDNLSVFLT